MKYFSNKFINGLVPCSYKSLTDYICILKLWCIYMCVCVCVCVCVSKYVVINTASLVSGPRHRQQIISIQAKMVYWKAEQCICVCKWNDGHRYHNIYTCVLKIYTRAFMVLSSLWFGPTFCRWCSENRHVLLIGWGPKFRQHHDKISYCHRYMQLVILTLGWFPPSVHMSIHV